MEKFNELLTKLKKLEIIQFSGDWAENLPDDIWEEYFNENFEEVKKGLDVDEHRWYETSITVIKIFGRFLGIRHITNMYSAQQDFEDCYEKIKFMEMKEVPSITYECI